MTIKKVILPLLTSLITLLSYNTNANVLRTDTVYALCESPDFMEERCQLPRNTISVTRIARYSKARCDVGTANFSYDSISKVITVNNGCRAKYRVKLDSVAYVRTVLCEHNINNGYPQECGETYIKDIYGNYLFPTGPIWKEGRRSKAICHNTTTPGAVPHPFLVDSWGENYGVPGFWTSQGCRGTFSQIYL